MVVHTRAVSASTARMHTYPPKKHPPTHTHTHTTRAHEPVVATGVVVGSTVVVVVTVHEHTSICAYGLSQLPWQPVQGRTRIRWVVPQLHVDHAPHAPHARGTTALP